MTDAAAADGAAEENGGAGKKKKLIMIGGAAAVLLIGGGAGAYFMLSGGSEPMPEEQAADVEQVKPVFYYDLPEMTVNLTNGNSQRSSFIKIQVSLEVPEQAMIAKIEPNLPRVLDAFQVYLRELRVTDLQGSAGMFRMKEELQRRINRAVYPARIDDVLFKNILIQ
ncbi:Flagellar FliL protein [Hartmannibacter diazotrophicus]|uniref:Flagellar protein FliL n=1 Tax=Hartmannibacter diazotrophicus TaxID=1482074 RepID=A0A2C9D7A9_9HYPH|nr:flagellar basal body-associated FliL family protein [Hartmannibacter diazotrophicus]SON56214.1 Flagellar FliL protein [Hartmannibacter diazotrophicus]